MGNITASPNTLLRQASMTAHDYMLEAKNNIDSCFSPGYAKAHPNLVAGFMIAASLDMVGCTIAKEITEGLEALAGEVNRSGLDQIAEAIDRVSSSLDELPIGES